MRVLYLVRLLAAGSGALLAAGAARSQAAPDVAHDDVAHARPPAWVLKGGLRLTHLSYSRSGTAWQMLLPASVGLEYRLNSRFSLYTQLDTDVQLRDAARSRRNRATWGATLPVAAAGLGGRYYYGRPAGAVSYLPAGPEFGRYLALEGGTDLTQQAAARSTYAARRPNGNSAALLSPYLYARWGIQNRLRPHLLYDLNAGLGLVAPAHAAGERLPAARRLDVAAQVNILLYFAN